MPWSAASFIRMFNWKADRDNGIKIRADRLDSEFDNYDAGLEQLLLRSGANSPTADINWGGHLIKNLAPGIEPNDAATVIQLEGPTPTRVTVQPAVAQTYVPSAQVTVNFGNEVYDSLGEFDNATGVFTAGSPGDYLVILMIDYISSAVANTTLIAGIYRSGAKTSYDFVADGLSRPASSRFALRVVEVLHLEAGETITAKLEGTVPGSVLGPGAAEMSGSFLTINRLHRSA